MTARFDRSAFVAVALGDGPVALRALVAASLLVVISCATDGRVRVRSALGEIERLELRDLPEDAASILTFGTDDAWFIRARAARALGRTRGEVSRSSLTDWLDAEEDSRVRRDVGWALGRRFPSASRDEWRQKLRSDDPLTRRAALIALATYAPETIETAEPWPADYWPQFFATERDPRVRWLGFWVLQRNRQLAARHGAELVLALSGPNSLAALYAAEALRDIDESLGVEELLAVVRRRDEVWWLREAAWQTLAAYLRRPALEPAARLAIERTVVEATSATDFTRRDARSRRAAFAALSAAQGEEAQARLLRHLRSQDLDAVAGVLATQRKRRGSFVAAERAVLRECQDLLDRAPALRAAWLSVRATREPGFASGVGSIAEQRTLLAARSLAPAALRILSQSDDEIVRRLALSRMAQTLGDAVIEPAMTVLRERRAGEWPTRILILDVLLALDDAPRPAEAAGVVDALEVALDDPVAWVRRRAALELMRRGRPSPIEARRVPVPFDIDSGVERLQRPPVRVRVTIGDGEVAEGARFRIELHGENAPQHVGALLHRVEIGAMRRQTVSGVSSRSVRLTAPIHPSDPLAEIGVAAEPSPGLVLRGDVYSVPAHWTELSLEDSVAALSQAGPSRPGDIRIALRPRPELSGRATVWGRVVEGIDAVDRLEVGDEISFEVTHR